MTARSSRRDFRCSTSATLPTVPVESIPDTSPSRRVGHTSDRATERARVTVSLRRTGFRCTRARVLHGPVGPYGDGYAHRILVGRSALHRRLRPPGRPAPLPSGVGGTDRLRRSSGLSAAPPAPSTAHALVSRLVMTGDPSGRTLARPEGQAIRARRSGPGVRDPGEEGAARREQGGGNRLCRAEHVARRLHRRTERRYGAAPGRARRAVARVDVARPDRCRDDRLRGNPTSAASVP